MRIYLIRHSVPSDTDYDEEPDPELTDEGRQIVETLADWMADKDEVPNVLFASPTSRTQETADILKAKLGLPTVKTDVGIGPEMSIRALVRSVAQDKAMTRVAIVSHHESISHGLREISGQPWPHLDMMAQGELRILKVGRGKLKCKEHRRILPSDLGGDDHY